MTVDLWSKCGIPCDIEPVGLVAGYAVRGTQCVMYTREEVADYAVRGSKINSRWRAVLEADCS